MRRTMNATRRTADVQRLSGVFLEMYALDFDPHNFALNLDVEISLDAQRLVVLRDLEVLRHVGIEVVLASEPAPRRDRAVQGEADSDRRLNRHCIRDRQRSRQAQACRAGVRVRRRTESRRAPAEHLRDSAELDVRLKTEYRLESRQRLFIRGAHSAGASSRSRWPRRSFNAASSAAPTR